VFVKNVSNVHSEAWLTDWTLVDTKTHNYYVDIMTSCTCKQATGYASQLIWCLS